MPHGCHGKILRADLSASKFSTETPGDIFYRRYVGGEGFVAYFLLKELTPSVDSLSPENKLIFAAGPVTGTPIPGGGRNSVGAKSPLTGGFGEAEVGGHWGAELKHAGFDAIIVEGKAESPIYLWVHDGEAEIRDASRIWGTGTGDAEKTIREEIGDNLVRVAQIGPGGEKMVRYACVINDLKDAAGRTGMGAVMGSKNLKAVAVRGHKRLDVSDPEKLREMAKSIAKNVSDLNLHKFGTGAGMESGVASGNLPTHNFRDGNFSQPEAIDAKTIEKAVRIGMDGCYACPVRCKKVVQIKEPLQVDPAYGGPEYETLAALGSNCGVDDLAALCKANEICNRYSLDTISTGVAIAFAMECYENGMLTEEDTGGLKLNFGNAKAMLKMVEMIGQRQGLGDILAEGVKRAAEKIGRGSEKFAVHVKGQEVPMHEPRLKRSLGLGYAVSPTGADHIHNLHDMGLATDGRSLDRLSSLGVLETIPLESLGPRKIRALINHVDWRVLDNCLLLCIFVRWNFIQKTEIVRAVTGWNTTAWELMRIGERVTTMARAFNIREGFAKKDDWLPDRFFHPTTVGPLSETSVDPEKLEKARSIYYEMMGWDEQGIPKKVKLEELDIGWVAELLPSA
ncbi:MAG: aldehyde ferredoxin oxidoreductase family protein [Candidatus Bathyarchaeota archaeon]|nr:aldehyde ferredoxin oxidoreductase family protein [Candidatus Bathyarchaeota archaeon]